MPEQVKFWRDARFANLELLHAHYVTHAFNRHAHDTFAIGVILSGAEGFTYRGKRHVAPAGHIVLINPGEPHTGQAAMPDGWTYRMLYPDVSLLQQAAAAVGRSPHTMPYFPDAVVWDVHLRRLIVRLHQALETPTPRLEQDSRLIWTLAQLVARHGGDRPVVQPIRQEHQAIQQVRAYLDACSHDNPTVEDLAELANLSPFYLLRTFRQQVGMPPHAYLMQVRLSRAKALLCQGWAIANVAQETGFADQSHLSRQFKRTWGITPGQYQRTTCSP